MNPQAKKALLSHLLDLAKHISPCPPAEPLSGLTWSQPGGHMFSLSEPHAQDLREIVNNLARQHPWSERFSEKYIRNSLALVLFKARDDGEDAARRQLDEVVTMLDNYSIERTVYVPVSGVILSVDELKLGRVVLKTFDDNLFDTITVQFDSLCAAETNDHRMKGIRYLKKQAQEELHGKVCAEFREIAEPGRAVERAQEEARRAIELITFACAALYPSGAPQSNSVLGLSGETQRLGPWTLSVADREVNTSHNAPASAMPITIDKGSLIGLERSGVMVLSDLLARSPHKLTDLEQALLRSVHWFAAAQAQYELENRLLNLITSMETLLTEKGRNAITSNIAESVALVIAKPYDDRKSIKEFIARIYGVRSGVSHGGNKEVFESDVVQLKGIAAMLIKTLVHRLNELRTKSDLSEWLERTRLGAEP